jgi:hypothetical protein
MELVNYVFSGGTSEDEEESLKYWGNTVETRYCNITIPTIYVEYLSVVLYCHRGPVM